MSEISPSDKNVIDNPADLPHNSLVNSDTVDGDMHIFLEPELTDKFLDVELSKPSIGNYSVAKESSVSLDQPTLAATVTQKGSGGSQIGLPNLFKNFKFRASDSSTELIAIAKILDSSRIAILKEVADKNVMIHYIAFYEKLLLIADLAANVKTSMLFDLISTKLEDIQKTFFLENSPLKLKLFSENAKASLLEGIKSFRAANLSDKIEIEFLNPIRDETLHILADACLTKLKQRKKKELQMTASAKALEKTVDSMLEVLNTELECDKMLRIMAKQRCLGNYFYYLKQNEVITYASTASSAVEKQTLKNMIKNVGKEFILKGSPLELPISEKLKLDFEEALKDMNTLQPYFLEPTTKEVLEIMLSKCFSLYLNPVDDHDTSKNSTSKETAVSTSLATEISSSSGISSTYSIGQPKSLQKGKSAENSSQEMEKILDNPAKIKVLKEVSDKTSMNYINFYKRQSLIRDLATNDANLMLLKMMGDKLEEIQNDYLLEKAPFKLKNITDSSKSYLIEGIKGFKTLAVSDQVDVKFLDPATDEVLQILGDSLLSKFKHAMKSHDTNSSAKAPANAKVDDNAIQLLIKVLDTESECDKMIEVLAKQHCMENYFYYQQQKEVYKYAATALGPIEKQTLKKMIKNLGKDFIYSSAPSELNIPSKLRSDFEEAAKDGNIQVLILDPITKEVLNMMLRNTFPTYLKNK